MSVATRSARILGRNGRFHQIIRFCLVGGSGTVVNLVAFITFSKLIPIADRHIVFGLWPTPYNVRWLHVLSLMAFIVANISNFELNRIWTFRHSGVVDRTRFGHFFLVGLGAQFVGFFILTALTHPGSPVRLPETIFDGSTGLRTMKYWAQLIMIILTTPISFLINKFWTFSHDGHRSPPAPSDETDLPGESVAVTVPGPVNAPVPDDPH